MKGTCNLCSDTNIIRHKYQRNFILKLLKSSFTDNLFFLFQENYSKNPSFNLNVLAFEKKICNLEKKFTEKENYFQFNGRSCAPFNGLKLIRRSSKAGETNNKFTRCLI